jgi:hypothetical protein
MTNTKLHRHSPVPAPPECRWAVIPRIFPLFCTAAISAAFFAPGHIPGYRFRLFRSLNVVGKFKPKWSQKPFSNVTDSAALESEVSDQEEGGQAFRSWKTRSRPSGSLSSLLTQADMRGH